jgi:hypothetical protein
MATQQNQQQDQQQLSPEELAAERNKEADKAFGTSGLGQQSITRPEFTDIRQTIHAVRQTV